MRAKVVHLVTRKDGKVVGPVEAANLQVNDGINWMAQVLGNQWGDVSVTGNSPIQIAVSETADTPSSGTTNLWGEIAADGLSRQTATFSHTDDASSFTQSASWFYTGASTVTIATAALASALTDATVSADTHFAVTNLSPVAVLDSNDTLTIDWGIFW